MTEKYRNHRIAAVRRYYQDGVKAAGRARIQTPSMRRLYADKAFWQGFHDARPAALVTLGMTVLEDPTRQGGWCVRELDAE